MTAARAPVLNALRAATAATHESLETALAIERIDLAGYRSLLERFLGFYEPLESQMPCYAQHGWLDGVDRRKLPSLLADLRALGYSPQEIDALPRCELPAAGSPAAQLGRMYVIEGSTLGGAHIARHVLPRLGINANTGGAFFQSYGPDVGRNWRAYLNVLEQRVVSAADRDDAVRGACETFSLLQRWLILSSKDGKAHSNGA